MTQSLLRERRFVKIFDKRTFLQGDPPGPQQADQLPNGPAGLEAAEPGGSFRYMNVRI